MTTATDAIDVLVSAYFQAFGDRVNAGRVEDLQRVFADGAVVFVQGDVTQRMTVEAFVAPRPGLLSERGLTDFREWEVEGRTFTFGRLAVRVCRYAQRGLKHGAPFEGGGWKVFVLHLTDSGWKISTMAWSAGDAALPLDTARWTEKPAERTAPPAPASHEGHCHCGTVSFRFTSDLGSPFVCNCSFCKQRGAVLQRVSAADFELLTGADDLGEYGKRDFSKHHFCRRCGIQTFTRLNRGGQSSVAVNLHCVPSVDTSILQPDLFDGAHRL